MTLKNIKIPPYLKKGIKPTTRNFKLNSNAIGFDTETNKHGEPYLLICKNHKALDIIEVDKDSCEHEFINWLYRHSYGFGSRINVAFAHNLAFDLAAIFCNHHKKFDMQEFIIQGKTDLTKYVVDVKVGICVFADVYLYKDQMSFGDDTNKYKKKGVQYHIHLRDSFAFTHTSLEKSAKDLKLEHQKKTPPKWIGEVEKDMRSLPQTHREVMLNYARYDGLVQHDLSEKIMNIHREYGIGLCVSIPQMAAKILKKRFLKDDDILEFPKDDDCVKIATLSYHGGKNGFYLDKPQMVRDVYEADVNSMYPNAMAQIPNFNHCSYYYVDYFDEDAEGVYRVTGNVAESKYHIIPKHEFGQDENFYHGTYIEDVCLTSYELRQALYDGLIDIDRIEGYIVSEDKTASNPLKDYVYYFYNKKKNTPETDSQYYIAKMYLCSCYGKFAQSMQQLEGGIRDLTIFEVDGKNIIEQEKEFIAGGLYNPVIASLITGYARTHLYQLETKYDALDSSTDSIKTRIKPRGVNKELGGLSIKNFGDCLFIRNKFYVHFGDKISFAKHGCQAELSDIIRMYINKEHTYKHTRMIKVKESLVRKDLIPLTWKELEASINIEW